MRRGTQVDTEHSVEIRGVVRGMIAVTVLHGPGGGDPVAHRPRDTACLAEDLPEGARTDASRNVDGILMRLPVTRDDVDDAAGAAAPPESGGGPPEYLDALDRGPVDVVEVRREAGRIVEREAVEEDLDSPDSPLRQKALPANREVYPLAVGLVVDLHSRHELQRLVGRDRLRRGLLDRLGADDARRAGVLTKGDLHPGTRDEALRARCGGKARETSRSRGLAPVTVWKARAR